MKKFYAIQATNTVTEEVYFSENQEKSPESHDALKKHVDSLKAILGEGWIIEVVIVNETGE